MDRLLVSVAERDEFHFISFLRPSTSPSTRIPIKCEVAAVPSHFKKFVPMAGYLSHRCRPESHRHISNSVT
jgi:hypothetical protein